jgi:hypothetical protein
VSGIRTLVTEHVRDQRIGAGLPADLETSIWKRAAISAIARSMFAMS